MKVCTSVDSAGMSRLLTLIGNAPPTRIELLRRAKVNRGGWHYGVEVHWDAFQRPTVFEFQKGIGIRQVTQSEFRSGLEVTTLESVTGYFEVATAWARLQEVVASSGSYDFLHRNCEHVARFVVQGESRSSQVSALPAFAFLALAALVGFA